MINQEELKRFLEVILTRQKVTNSLAPDFTSLSDEHKKLLIDWYIKENSTVKPIECKLDLNDTELDDKDKRLKAMSDKHGNLKESFSVDLEPKSEELEPEIEEAGATLIEMTFKEFQDMITDEPIRILDFQNLKEIYDVIYSKGFKILKIEIDKDELYDKVIEK